MVHKISSLGTYMVHENSSLGTCMVHENSSLGTCIVHENSSLGTCMVHENSSLGTCMVHESSSLGTCMVHENSSPGTYMVHEKSSLGTCMVPENNYKSICVYLFKYGTYEFLLHKVQADGSALFPPEAQLYTQPGTLHLPPFKVKVKSNTLLHLPHLFIAFTLGNPPPFGPLYILYTANKCLSVRNVYLNIQLLQNPIL